MLAVRVLVALGQPEVDYEDLVLRALGAADQEVVRLDVSVDDSFFVALLDEFDHLDADQEDRFEAELAFAALEEVFERGAEQVHDHDVELLAVRGLLVADVVQVGDVGLAPQLMDQLRFPEQHHVLLVLHRLLHLRHHDLLRLLLLALVHLSERAATQLLDDLVAPLQYLLALREHFAVINIINI